jgi:hypothetical protein
MKVQRRPITRLERVVGWADPLETGNFANVLREFQKKPAYSPRLTAEAPAWDVPAELGATAELE